MTFKPAVDVQKWLIILDVPNFTQGQHFCAEMEIQNSSTGQAQVYYHKSNILLMLVFFSCLSHQGSRVLGIGHRGHVHLPLKLLTYMYMYYMYMWTPHTTAGLQAPRWLPCGVDPCVHAYTHAHTCNVGSWLHTEHRIRYVGRCGERRGASLVMSRLINRTSMYPCTMYMHWYSTKETVQKIQHRRWGAELFLPSSMPLSLHIWLSSFSDNQSMWLRIDLQFFQVLAIVPSVAVYLCLN